MRTSGNEHSSVILSQKSCFKIIIFKITPFYPLEYCLYEYENQGQGHFTLVTLEN